MKPKLILVLTTLLSLLLTANSSSAREALFDRIEAELAKDKVSQASFEQLESYLLANPRSSDAHLYMGMILEAMGLKDQALPQLKLAVEYGPDDPDALVELCKREIKDNHVNVAIGLLNEGIKKFPDNPKVLYLVGDFLVKEKQARMAKEVLERAYHMDRQHKIIGLPTSLARLYLDLNLTRSVLLATVDLEKLPNYDRALRVRGVAYRRMHSYRQAAADLSRVFANDPTVVPLDVDLADSYFWLGEYKKALEPTLFMVALTCVPDIENPMAIEKLTRLLRKIPEKEIAPALEQAIKPIKDRRKLDVFYYQVGIALDKVNMTDLANQYYREAIEGDPELVGPYYRLGVNQEVFEKDYEAALSNYTKAHNLRPWDNEIGLAQIRLHDRMTNQASDISLKLKRFFNELGK